MHLKEENRFNQMNLADDSAKYPELPRLIALAIILSSLYFCRFTGFAGAFPNPHFLVFDFISEELVLGKVFADRFDLSIPGDFNLARLYYAPAVLEGDPEQISAQSSLESNQNAIVKNVPLGHILQVSKTNMEFQDNLPEAQRKRIAFNPYISQYGVQGLLFSFLHNVAYISLQNCRYINAALLSIVLSVLVIGYARILSKTFAAFFLLTTIGTSWLTGFAGNLYWVAWLWFLPTLCSIGVMLSKRKHWKIVAGILLYFSFVLKFLAGYEYITTIILNAAIVFILGAIGENPKLSWKSGLKMFLLVNSIGLTGFITALCFHAGMRGEGVLDGLTNIFFQDVLRSTWGSLKQLPGLYKSNPMFQQAAEADLLTMLRRYYFHWGNEKVLSLSFVGAVLGIVLLSVVNFERFRKCCLLLAVLALPAASWYILAKSHSYVHFVLNYVLQYFGFVAGCLSVAACSIRFLFIRFKGEANRVLT